MVSNKRQQCRFEAPFMLNRSTVILSAMEKDELNFKTYLQRSKAVWIDLENKDYSDISSFKSNGTYTERKLSRIGSNVRAGEVAIYHHVNDTITIVTTTIDMTERQSNFVPSVTSSVGEFCVAECIAKHCKKLY